MSFKDYYKSDLVDIANHYKVEIDAYGNKDAIITALLDANLSPEQWERDKARIVDGDEAADRLPEPEPVKPEVLNEPAPEESTEVAVRFVGSNRSYQIGKFIFTEARPFQVMTREQFNNLDPRLFREATREELREFYS